MYLNLNIELLGTNCIFVLSYLDIPLMCRMTRSVEPTVFWPLKNSSPTPTTPAERASHLIVARMRPNCRQLLNDRIHYLINTLNCLIMTNFNGTVWWGEKHDMVCYDRVIITAQDGHHTVKSQTPPHPAPFFVLILPKWCKEMAARPRCVAPLGPHFRPSTDSPLPRGRPISSAAWGRPPNARLNMLTGRNWTPSPFRYCRAASTRSSFPFFCGQGAKKVEEMISINHNVNHYCSEQKSSWEIPWWKWL